MPKKFKSTCFASFALKISIFAQILENFAKTCVIVSVHFRSSVWSHFFTSINQFISSVTIHDLDYMFMVLDGSTYIILDPRPSVCFGGCCSCRSAWGRKLRKEPPPRAPAPGRWPGVTQRDPQGTEPGGGQVWMCSGPPQWTGGAWKTGNHSAGPIPLSWQPCEWGSGPRCAPGPQWTPSMLAGCRNPLSFGSSVSSISLSCISQITFVLAPCFFPLHRVKTLQMWKLDEV